MAHAGAGVDAAWSPPPGRKQVSDADPTAGRARTDAESDSNAARPGSKLRGASTPAEAASARHFDATLRLGGLLTTTGFVGVLYGPEANYHLTPAWRVGAYFELVALEGGGDAVFYNEAYFSACRFGARGQWHSRPEHVVDPWVGVSLGPFVTTNLPVMPAWAHDPNAEPIPGRWGADIGLEAGLDFHLGSVFTIGAVYVVVFPVGPVKQKADSTPVGVYGSVPWFPLLRLGATF